MFRKLTIALGATVALAAAALAPSAASAHSHHHGWGWGHGFGIYAPIYAAAPVYEDCYVVRKVVATPYGPRVRRVPVCD
jgi:hypothetical protein